MSLGTQSLVVFSHEYSIQLQYVHVAVLTIALAFNLSHFPYEKQLTLLIPQYSGMA